MEEWLYVMMIKKTKEYRKLNQAGVVAHVENIRKLDTKGHIELAGAFKGFPSMAGMFLLKQKAMKKLKKFVNKSR